MRAHARVESGEWIEGDLFLLSKRSSGSSYASESAAPGKIARRRAFEASAGRSRSNGGSDERRARDRSAHGDGCVMMLTTYVNATTDERAVDGLHERRKQNVW